MNGQQFPINPKWQRQFDIATLRLQNLFGQLQKEWQPEKPKQSEQPQPAEQPAQPQPPQTPSGY